MTAPHVDGQRRRDGEPAGAGRFREADMRKIRTLHDELNNEHFTYIDGHEASDEELRELCEREDEDATD